MNLSNPHIVFYNRDNEIVAGVVEMPDKSKYKNYHPFMVESSKKIMEDLYQQDLKQLLANPIPFKEKKDELTIKWEVYCSLGKQYMGEFAWQHWSPELGKPYKIEGEIEIKCQHKGIHNSTCINYAFLKLKERQHILSFEQCLREEFLINTENYPKEYHSLFETKFNRALQTFKQQSKDALDTGARLPEQKEESQEKLWDDVLSLQGMFTDQGVCYDGNRAEFLEKLKSKFIIHRKP